VVTLNYIFKVDDFRCVLWIGGHDLYRILSCSICNFCAGSTLWASFYVYCDM